MNNEIFRIKVMEAVKKLTSFANKKYHKAEIEAELRKLQREILVLVFKEEHALNARLTIWDAYNQLERENEEKGGIANELLEEFRKGCKVFNNLIRAEISGNWGETQVFNRLCYLKGTNKIIRNLQLKQENAATEIDMVVFTKKAIFIIEVKNTKKNVFLDETGGFYRRGEYNAFDCNLKGKMDFRETLLKENLTDIASQSNKELNVVKLVVFTNNRIEVQNRCDELKICFLGQLPYIIDEFAGEEIYTEEDINKMVDALNVAGTSHEYEIEMDMDKFKLDFAELLVTLENTESKEEDEIAFAKARVERMKEEFSEQRTVEEQLDNNRKVLRGIRLVSGVILVIGLAALGRKALVKR